MWPTQEAVASPLMVVAAVPVAVEVADDIDVSSPPGMLIMLVSVVKGALASAAARTARQRKAASAEVVVPVFMVFFAS